MVTLPFQDVPPDPCSQSLPFLFPWLFLVLLSLFVAATYRSLQLEE